jgi:hypothetical protein
MIHNCEPAKFAPTQSSKKTNFALDSKLGMSEYYITATNSQPELFLLMKT